MKNGFAVGVTGLKGVPYVKLCKTCWVLLVPDVLQLGPVFKTPDALELDVS